MTWQRAGPAGTVLIKDVSPRSLGVFVWVSEPERGFLWPRGLGSSWTSFVPSVARWCPEGGDAGGNLVFEGRPSELAECEKSYTARYLKQLMKK